MSLKKNGLVPMNAVSKWMLLLTAGALLPSPLVAQVQTAPQPRSALPPATRPQPQTGPAATHPGAPVPGNPDYQPAQPSAADQLAPLPLPPVVWGVQDAQDLLAYIGTIGAEGLNPDDYDPAGLAAAIR